MQSKDLVALSINESIELACSWVISAIERQGAIVRHPNSLLTLRIASSAAIDGARKFASINRVDF